MHYAIAICHITTIIHIQTATFHNIAQIFCINFFCQCCKIAVTRNFHCFLHIHCTMCFIVITMYHFIFKIGFACTFKRKILPIWHIFHCRQCCHNFQCRPWWIQSLCCPVYQWAVFIGCQILPLCFYFIGVKIWICLHRQHTPR